MKEKIRKIWSVTKNAPIPMLLALVNLLLFLFAFIFIEDVELIDRILCIILGAIPTICFYSYANIISTYLRLKKIIFNIIFPFIIVIPYCFYLVFSMLFLVFYFEDSDITDISKYEQPQYYFPEKIPENYDEVKYYYYFPYSIDSVTEVVLYLKINIDFIDYYKKKYKPQTIMIHKAYKELNEPKKAEYRNDIIISEGFTRYLLISNCYLDNSCSHGEVGYILINENTKEILFYYKQW